MNMIESKNSFIAKPGFLSLCKDRKLAFNVALFAFLSLFILIGGQLSFNLLCALNVACLLTIIAYRFPYLTIILVFLLGQIIGLEAQALLPATLRQPALGSLSLRYFDPMLLGIVLAVMLKLLHRSKALSEFMFRDYLFWTLLIGWLAIEIIRSFGSYSIINIFGEFRTYYQYMLLIPYIVVFFQTEDEQWRLFKLLIVLSSLFILSGIIRGWMLYGFAIEIGRRWLSASANLALLNGMIALYLCVKHKALKVNNKLVIMLFVAFFVMTILNGHRSVWLATGVAFLALIFTGQVSFKSYILTWIAGIIACVGILYIFQMKGENIFLFLDNRMMAFTNYEYDATANWRYSLWIESLRRIMQNPLWGHGFGLHFNLYLSREVIITTSPHNLYISIAYQVGIAGLFLYLGFIFQVFRRIRKALNMQITSHQRTMILTTLVILISSSAYYIAYVFDYFTWLYVGVGIAVNNEKVQTRFKI